jgi:HSP20 family protein
MSWDEKPDRWPRKQRSWPRDFFDIDFDDMNAMIEEMFREMAESMPKELFREEKLPDGTKMRKMGPFVYGYSMTIGPDGKPVIREFGNVKPSVPRTPISGSGSPLEYRDEREPLVDILSDNGTIRVIAELPGVEKNEIRLQCYENTLTISVDKPQRKYFKEIELPSSVEPRSSKANYRNGVLEIILNKMGTRKSSGEFIKID